MDELIAKADVLLETLPYLRRFAGRTVVIKYGGHAMLDEQLQSGFAEDVVLLRSIGLRPVIVHGGGPQIEQALSKHGIKTHFVRGMRVTDEDTMEIVEMVLGGQINKTIVGMIHRHGGKAIGLTGKDGRLLHASKLKVKVEEKGRKAELVDVGLVGKIERVDAEIIERIAGTDFIPVIAPIATDDDGGTYNVNADVAAGEIAAALKADKLILLTDVAGIKDGAGDVQPYLSAEEARRQIKAGSIASGMVPKVECAIHALENGVGQVHIIDGRVKHAVLLEIFTTGGVGTEVLLDKRSTAGKGATAAGARTAGGNKAGAGAIKQAAAPGRAAKKSGPMSAARAKK
ncbi:MAG TPA: acetylglutamate kinase [Candidatus Limnocylindrales bacterium]|nr:acetylglutamate kinase [Candidatus Limnocylindrales bacterium]